ncbi:oxidoreductase [Larkinella terrae]|uniref:NAD-dependent epimerase/dehydratase family protein n=1 Tax=Larkinella terrae TaxID=2025311 RepID=A0A7K0EVF7_9BACT|nr:oxidoreductase [Larkinella terrae]MRS65546.1 NAD-dependent epimerase/dehydratase family protein [Larkinella terrae]
MINPTRKTALVVGATGLIGNLLTHRLVDSPAYEKVKVLVRHSLGWQHPHLQEIQYDFDHPNGLLVQADDVFCCLGTTMKKAGSKEAFQKVDYQYPLDVAKRALVNRAKQFLLVSSMGANPSSSFFYNRVKGELERDLTALNYPALLIFRPSLLLGERKEYRLGERIGEGLMKLFNPLIPARYKGVQGTSVANAMLQKAQRGLAGTHIFESDQLQPF